MFELSKILRLIPTNLVSYLTGIVSRIAFPHALQTCLNVIFARIFGINMAEAERPISSYSSIEELFIRRLRPGMRPIKSAVVSPSDGFLARSASVDSGDLIQAKGISYSVASLLGKPNLRREDAAWFATVYLAPHNYHRVHTPMAGVLKRALYIPGELWPVNKPSVKFMPRLFARNERIVFEIETKDGGLLHAVMVGALNVGRMLVAAKPDFVSNSLKRQFPFGNRPAEIQIDKEIMAGEELGTFMLGSTVVLVFNEVLKNRYRFVQLPGNTPILMGQSLIEVQS